MDTHRSNSIIQPYSVCPEVPDFGACNAVSPYANFVDENEIRFYYTHQSLESAGTKVYSFSDYDSLLREWGFETSIPDDNYNSAIIPVYYNKGTPQAYYNVCVGVLDSYDNIQCVSVTIRIVERAPAQSYVLHPSVPDFGSYFHLPLFNTADYSIGYYYYYDWSAVYSAGIYDTFVDDYTHLLNEWGFSYRGAETNQYGTFYEFSNHIDCSVNFIVYDDYIAVLVLPDFVQ